MNRPAASCARLAAAVALALPAGHPTAAPARHREQPGQAREEPGRGFAPVVRISEGAVRGIVKDGVYQFLGIPYATPPLGELRWRPSQPVASWSGVRNATAFAPICAQITTLGVFAGPANDNEDCLYLNVFTPKLGNDDQGGKLPVLVWIHGGGHVDGASSDYDGSKLAKDGRTVVVTINYRLGLLGYLAHPALDAEDHTFGNYGLTDQQLALRWVRRNIPAFGGDARNVTLGGQSAGSSSTAANMLSPRSAGLFHRAILQSGALLTIPSLATAEARGLGFAAAAGCPGTDAAAAACLRALPVSQIMALQGTASANGPWVTGLLVDGTLLPEPPRAAFTAGHFNRVPVMSGSTLDEWSFFASIIEYFSQTPMTAAEYQMLVTNTYVSPTYAAGTASQVLSLYPVGAYPSPSLAYTAVWTDALFACRHQVLNPLLAQWVPVYAYEFTDRTAPYYFPPLSFPVGAAHTIDIQYLFPLWHGGPLGIIHPLNKEQEKLSDRLVDFWTTFARDGNPNGHSKNHPWPRYVASLDNYLVENIPKLSMLTGSEFSSEHQCDFWRSVYLF